MKTGYAFLLITLAIFLSLIFLLRLPAEAAGRLEHVAALRPDFGTQPVAVTADERVLTLLVE